MWIIFSSAVSSTLLIRQPFKILSRHEGSLVADRLRSDWVKILGKGRQWQFFDKEYPRVVNKDTELQCYYYQRYWDIKNVAITAEVLTLWFSSIAIRN